jgi:hypothetical protein
MVQPNVFSAAFVLNALSMVAAAPSEQNQGTVSFAHLTQEEARELVRQWRF